MFHHLWLSVYRFVVLLRWQEFATRSVAAFFDEPLRCQCRWRISVVVQARIVNGKQVDVRASRSDLLRLSWNALIAHGMQPRQ